MTSWIYARLALLAGLSLCLASRATYAQEVKRLDSGDNWNINWQEVHDPRAHWILFEEYEGPVEIGGWASAGFTANGFGNRSGNGNAPLPFNNVSDSPVFNQVWLYAEKPINTEDRCLDWGVRLDYVFGADGPDFQTSGDQGWDFGWNTSRDYGSSIPQLYAEVGTDQWTMTVGYFLGLQGFEAGQSIDNFFYSHNYAFGYGVPGTHSGVLVSSALTDEITIDAGWSMGWNSWWSNYLGASMFIGGISWYPTDDLSLTYHVSAGDLGDGTAKDGVPSSEGLLYAHAIIFTYDVTERTTFVIENTVGSNTGIGDGNNHWYSLTGYLYYEINDCWETGLRLDWFQDTDGQRVAVNGAGAGSYYEATLGLNWFPNEFVTIRPEVRYDWFEGQGQPFNSNNGGVSGSSTYLLTVGLDCVFTF
ncbi:outer membrane beta-barrel protein [Bremerella sp. P1]|uniref:outer membrane beta-barrel protein n=1 Tax=Bremerella sp. P1 TaxID=3026424 RepID=UPI0023681D15|nr:outer membrane beta-barrel protein [Bremerella sp. P1]WDI42104.1 outer membrane beta-barrel protein [Bremerella sp. P1]